MKTLKISLLYLCLLALYLTNAISQEYYGAAVRSEWLKNAEQHKPALIKTVRRPQGLVDIVKDDEAYQGWKALPAGEISALYDSSFKTQSGVVVDFGEHLTGHFSFSIQTRWGTADAPLRFKLTFAEVPAELTVPFDPYPGTLSRAWLQDEVLTVMLVPSTVTIPRRLAFRYVKIELLGSSPYFDFRISDLQCEATTSANNPPPALAPGTDPLIAAIDSIGLATLKECMQTVYEDGPKRDQRLWIGDLYLESLANTYSFKNHDLTKRCLYLLAALSREDGYVHSNIFENPEPHPQAGAPFLFDYSLLYNVTLKEYLEATGDQATATDLWPVAKKQLDNSTKFLREDGLFDSEAARKARWWLFVDWKDGLDRQAPIQGIIIYALKQTYELAKLLGKEQEVAEVPGLIDRMTDGARKLLPNKQTGLFESGPDKQVSYASQAWMVLSGVATKQEAQRALKAVANLLDAVRPGAPYLYHYYVEALIQSGMQEEARRAVVDYWGGMVKKGADTFWEVYDPDDELLSPYNFYPVNSYCHAWSCTPVYFIRKYAEIFQKQS